jgi:hypothetical protein
VPSKCALLLIDGLSGGLGDRLAMADRACPRSDSEPWAFVANSTGRFVKKAVPLLRLGKMW